MEDLLPVIENFHSIQGEGAHAGKSAFFIRLAGCKIQCSWCDTKESWSFTHYPKKAVLELAKDAAKAKEAGASFLVITGGEPLHHDLNPLCDAVKEITSIKNSNPMPIHLETSGVYKLSGAINWITLSPKRHSPPKKELLESCQEIKVIINDQEDIVFAEEMASQSRNNQDTRSTLKSKYEMKISSKRPHLFLQPGWDNDNGKRLAIEFVKKNPQWRLSMQTHKWLGIT